MVCFSSWAVWVLFSCFFAHKFPFFSLYFFFHLTSSSLSTSFGSYSQFFFLPTLCIFFSCCLPASTPISLSQGAPWQTLLFSIGLFSSFSFSQRKQIFFFSELQHDSMESFETALLLIVQLAKWRWECCCLQLHLPDVVQHHTGLCSPEIGSLEIFCH